MQVQRIHVKYLSLSRCSRCCDRSAIVAVERLDLIGATVVVVLASIPSLWSSQISSLYSIRRRLKWKRSRERSRSLSLCVLYCVAFTLTANTPRKSSSLSVTTPTSPSDDEVLRWRLPTRLTADRAVGPHQPPGASALQCRPFKSRREST